MATKQEIYDGVRGVEERLDSLLPGIRSHLDRPLPTGTWTVHDALCHIAADANAVPRLIERLGRLERGEPDRAPGFNMDEHNEQNIAQRRSKPVDDVVGEINAGLKVDVDAIAGLSDADFGREIPGFRGNLTTVGDNLAFNLIRHNHIHLDDIEQALAESS